MALIENPMLGSDPELFIFSKTEGRVVPSIGLLGGTKAKPKPLGVKGFYVQEDNVLAEFNIPPASTREKFISYIGKGKDLLSNILPEGLEPITLTSHKFHLEQFEDPRAFEFGCTPDYNAWEVGEKHMNVMAEVSFENTLRTAGGHILLGYNNPVKEVNVNFVKLCDALLGVPSIILDRDSERRSLYGKAGAFRNKPFGVEYRTLSSFWLASPKLTGWVWDQAMEAVNRINTGNYALIEDKERVVNIINSGDVKEATSFVLEHGIKLP